MVQSPRARDSVEPVRRKRGWLDLDQFDSATSLSVRSECRPGCQVDCLGMSTCSEVETFRDLDLIAT